MLAGEQRAPGSITNIPTGYFVLFPNSEDGGAFYVKDSQGNVFPLSALNPVIGSQRAFGSRSDQQNSTSDVFTEYLSIAINNSTSQNVKHEFHANFTWGYASASTDIRIRVLVDGQQLGDEFRMEPKDGGSDQRMYTHIFDELDFTPGSHTISLEFASSVSGTQSRMYSAKIRTQRVA